MSQTGRPITPIRIDPAELAAFKAAAQAEGLTLSEWLRRAGRRSLFAASVLASLAAVRRGVSVRAAHGRVQAGTGRALRARTPGKGGKDA